MEIQFHLNWIASVTALLATALLAAMTGWLTSHRILGLRPLEILREE